MFLQVPFPVLQGEGVEYLGQADEAVIAISNYRLHIKFKDSVINVSARLRPLVCTEAKTLWLLCKVSERLQLLCHATQKANSRGEENLVLSLDSHKLFPFPHKFHEAATMLTGRVFYMEDL